MTDTVLTPLERAILKSKGVGDDHFAQFEAMGLTSKSGFETVGNAQTLADISGLDVAVAEQVMAWALGVPAASAAPAPAAAAPTSVTIEDPSVIKCTNCDHKQPHDYKTGDLCPNCGRQAQPVSNCYWCHADGSGKFCRSCGAEYVKNLDYEIAVLLKREGVAKSRIASELADMEDAEKEARLTQLRSGRY